MTNEELKELFKDVRGMWRTTSLFEETCEDPAKYPPLYTLQASDTSSCVSLKQKYLELGDFTEYTFATMYLGGWDHWLMIGDSFRLKPHIAKWRAELEMLVKSRAVAKIKDLSEGEGPSALAAAKWLTENAGKRGEGTPSKRGRPSKEEIAGNLRASTRDKDQLDEDAARIGLKVVK